jgi:hypothetical protein
MVKVKTLNGGRGCERIRMCALNPAHSSSVATGTDVKGPVGISNAEGDSNEVPQSCSRGTKGLDPGEAASKNFNIQQHHRKNCTSPLVSWLNGGICVLNFFVICCKAHAELDKSARASRSYHIAEKDVGSRLSRAMQQTVLHARRLGHRCGCEHGSREGSTSKVDGASKRGTGCTWSMSCKDLDAGGEVSVPCQHEKQRNRHPS